MKKGILIIAVGLLLFALIYFPASRLLRPVALVEAAQTGTAINAVTGKVEIWANADIQVKSRQRGVISELLVDAGHAVETGQVIAILAAEDLDLRIEQARIQLEAAKARSAVAPIEDIELEAIEERLAGTELAISLQQAPASRLDAVKRDRRKAEVYQRLAQIQRSENLHLLENQLAQLSLQKEQMTIRAPFAGTVVALSAFTGDLVNDGSNIVRLVSHGRFALMELAEEDFFGVESGQAVTIRLAGYPDRAFAGRVSSLENVADASSKKRNLFVDVDAPDPVLVPGLTGEGYLVKDERDGAVLVARRALVGNSIHVVVDGAVEVRRVRPGYLGLNKAEILEGVQAGERVILEDQNLFKPGDRVRMIESGAR
jgi:RND family efflux transporter MFP subunit